MSTRRSAGALPAVAACLVLALVLVLAAHPASGGRSPDGGLRLLEQTPWVAADGEMRLVLELGEPPPGTNLELTLHSRVEGRDELAEAVSGEDLGPIFSPGPSVPLDGSATAEDAVRDGWLVLVDGNQATVVLALRAEPSADPTRTYVPGSDQGVYPLSIDVRDSDGDLIDRLVTHLVRLPEAGTDVTPLLVGLVVPVHAPPALQPSGETVLSPEEMERLRATIQPLRREPTVPLTAWPTPETVAALGRLDQPEALALSEDLAASLDGRQLLGDSYVQLAPASWVDAGLERALAQQVTQGTDQLAASLAVRPDGRTWIADPTTGPRALTALRELGADQVVVPAQILEPLDPTALERSTGQAFDVLTSTGGRVRALAADPTLVDHLGSTGDPVLDAQRVLADLALLSFDPAGQPDVQRGVPLVLSPDEPPPEAFLETLLDGLAQPSMLRAVSLNALFRDVSQASSQDAEGADGEVLVRGLLPAAAPPLGAYPQQLESSETQLAGFRSMMGPQQPLPFPLEELQLTSGAAGLPAAERRTYLDALSARIQEAVGSIRVDQQAVTLTAREGVIPLSVRNDLQEPVTVRVEAESDRLDFPEGAAFVHVVEPGLTTLEIPVETRASGAFPLEVRVTSPDGVIGLSEARITVRSTAVPGLGIVLAALAALFLLVWWARHFRKARRASRLVGGEPDPDQADPASTQERFIAEL